MLDLPGRWQFYVSLFDDATASIFVNLDVGEPMPDPARPYLLISRIWLMDPDENGMADPQELEWITDNGLFQPEEVARLLDARFVGHLISQGCHDAFYYIGEPQTRKAADVLTSLWPNVTHRHGHDIRLDAHWAHYRDVLYPTPLEFRSIQNMEKLQEYQEEHLATSADPERQSLIAEEFGMDLDQVSIIDDVARGLAGRVQQYRRETLLHFLFFPSKETRSFFIKGIRDEGFTILDRPAPDPSMDPTPFGLLIEREESMSLPEIDDVVLSLGSKAGDFGGRYIDWEVARDDDEDDDQ